MMRMMGKDVIEGIIQPTPLILDFDPAGFVATGLDVDDDLALLALLSVAALAGNRRGDPPHHGRAFELLGVTLVAGNGPMRHVAANAKHLIRRE